MRPSAFATLISGQLHYQLSPALREYLCSVDAVYKRTGSFLETKAGCPAATPGLDATDLEFVRFLEKEYRAREEVLAESRSRRIKIEIGNVYWNVLTSIRDGSADTATLSKTPHVEMKTPSSQKQPGEALGKLLELKYVTLSKNNEPILTKKGANVLARLDPQQHGSEKVAENGQSVSGDHRHIDPTSRTATDCRLKLMLDCRGEGSYAQLLPQDVAQCTSIVKLPRGDCLLLKDDCPAALVERKTIPDLYASLYDGRIQRQLGSSATFPTILLVEDPQLLLVHESQLFQAVLDEVNRGTVSSIIQTTGAQHTAHVYEHLFRGASGLPGHQHACPSDHGESDPLSGAYPNSYDDWGCFIKGVLYDYSSHTAGAVVSAYPSYRSLAADHPSTVHQRLLTMGLPRGAAHRIAKLLSC